MRRSSINAMIERNEETKCRGSVYGALFSIAVFVLYFLFFIYYIYIFSN